MARHSCATVQKAKEVSKGAKTQTKRPSDPRLPKPTISTLRDPRLQKQAISSVRDPRLMRQSNSPHTEPSPKLQNQAPATQSQCSPTSPPRPTQSECTISSYASKLKTCPRGCLMQLSRKQELPSQLDKLINTLTKANIIGLKMNTKQPAIEHADRLEELLSFALSLARKFRGVRVGDDVYDCVARVKRQLSASIRMAGALKKAIIEDMCDSEDERDLAKTMENTIQGTKHTFSKSMCGIAEQLSKSSLIPSSPSSTTVANDLEHKSLTDGSVKFTLCASRLTKVFEERKKNGQSLIFLGISKDHCNGQVAKKAASPLRESSLTAIVANKDKILSSAKAFAERLQQYPKVAQSSQTVHKLNLNFSVSTATLSNPTKQRNETLLKTVQCPKINNC